MFFIQNKKCWSIRECFWMKAEQEKLKKKSCWQIRKTDERELFWCFCVYIFSPFKYYVDYTNMSPLVLSIWSDVCSYTWNSKYTTFPSSFSLERFTFIVFDSSKGFKVYLSLRTYSLAHWFNSTTNFMGRYFLSLPSLYVWSGCMTLKQRQHWTKNLVGMRREKREENNAWRHWICIHSMMTTKYGFFKISNSFACLLCLNDMLFNGKVHIAHVSVLLSHRKLFVWRHR